MIGPTIPTRLIESVFIVAIVASLLAGRADAQIQQSADSIPAFVRRAAVEHPEPGDRVWLHVWREPKLSDTVTVDERGRVLFPKIGLVDASALPIADFRDTVRARFAEYLRDAPVDVVVLRRVAVNGAVMKPDVYYVDVSMTLRDVIARAGGVTENGNPKNVAIVRGASRIPVHDWQNDRSPASDLRSGDQVVVGRKNWLELNALGAVSVAAVVASIVISLVRR
ncbi:MAG TPA: polysaccharide biosynthesis/export family protein [Gemmatimonadaceae bacterium]|nr:polysaccharide biosynthesis/export family protein [Gemmatimonadaceae bacterium]